MNLRARFGKSIIIGLQPIPKNIDICQDSTREPNEFNDIGG